VAGFAIYFGVLKATGYEIGLISIVVGLLVGGAVRKGAGGRGGWVYQLLAVFLTYTAIVASYTAVVIPGLLAQMEADRAANNGAAVANNVPANKAAAKAAPVGQPPPMPAKVEAAEATMPLPIALAVFVGFLYAVPILAGFEQPIGLFIIGFALWEAWKINRRVRLVIQGPFALGQEESDPGPAHV
jgi:hypothetical protein